MVGMHTMYTKTEVQLHEKIKYKIHNKKVQIYINNVQIHKRRYKYIENKVQVYKWSTNKNMEYKYT
jgi:hypothetical protein